MKIKSLIILSIILSVMRIIACRKKQHEVEALDPEDVTHVFGYGVCTYLFDMDEFLIRNGDNLLFSVWGLRMYSSVFFSGYGNTLKTTIGFKLSAFINFLIIIYRFFTFKYYDYEKDIDTINTDMLYAYFIVPCDNGH